MQDQGVELSPTVDSLSGGWALVLGILVVVGAVFPRVRPKRTR